MENAAKALEIAAGALTAILIMSLIAYFFSTARLSPLEEDSRDVAEQLAKFNLEYEVYDDIKLIKEDFENDLIDGYILYDEVLNTYSIYCDSSISGMNVTSFASAYLDDYNTYLGNLKLIDSNIDPEEIFDNFTIEIKDVSGEEMSTSAFLVELIMSISFTYIIMAITLAAVNMATSAIAVEKEHGTLETILTLPMSTNELIMGKYLANVVIGSIASLIGFVLTIVSFSISKNMFIKNGVKALGNKNNTRLKIKNFMKENLLKI